MSASIPITPQEQAAIQQICDIAALNPNVNREMRAQISAFCVQWQRRGVQSETATPDKK